MSTLSQFFGSAADGASTLGRDSTLTLFSETGSVTVPSSVEYMAYGAIGGGGGGRRFCKNSPNPGDACFDIGGGGGGFAFKDGPVTCPAPFAVCATVGAGGLSCPQAAFVNLCNPNFSSTSSGCFASRSGVGGTSCVTGISLGAITATGGVACINEAKVCGTTPPQPAESWYFLDCAPLNPSTGGNFCQVLGAVGGVGSGGDINTCGGGSFNCVLYWPGNNPTTPGAFNDRLSCEVQGCRFRFEEQGGGAGGLLGNGGAGAVYFGQENKNWRVLESAGEGGAGVGQPGMWCQFPAPSPSPTGAFKAGGGGGYGSGGGGGSGYCYFGSSTCCHAASAGGDGFMGRGAFNPVGNVGQGSYPVGQAFGEGTQAESGYIAGFTKNGCFSQAKTYFGAAGGGASSNCMAPQINTPNSIPAGAGGGGSGGTLEAKAGFGGGGADSSPGGFGGGGAGYSAPSSNPCGGQGVVMVEYWTTD